ncbi:MAG TPA: hypothetical protein VKW04_00220 [Planctomycetota bacterium]|nr:hypothetical protein [Planctomycetota bacterium]
MLKRLLPVLLLACTACDAIPGLLGTAANVAGAGAGSGSAPSPMPTGTTGIATTTSTSTAGATAATTTPTLPSPTATKSVTFDSARKLEYVDVYVDMGDPTGQRALVPYLMKPKDWMLVGCEMTSTTAKHYRFMKVSTNDGRELPDVDIFKQGR